jgi:SAM-dependent methyltransferase
MLSTEYTRQYYEKNWQGSLRSAKEVIPILLELVRPRRVIELGCGVGAWLSVLRSCGIEDVLGVDGDYVDKEQLLIPRERFLPFDLEKPFRIDEGFDLAISLEVAEHLPRSCAETLVDSLIRLAPVVLFSAAIPFQGGTHHLNEQWPDFWAAIFRRHEFVSIDCIRKRVWQNNRVDWWYAQNTLLYAKADLVGQSAALREAFERSSISQLSLIHPAKYLEAVDPERILLRNILPLARSVALKSIKWQARRGVGMLSRWVR